MKSVFPEDSHLNFHPIRFLKASILSSGAREMATKVTSRWFRCTPISLKLSAQNEQCGHPSFHSGANMKW